MFTAKLKKACSPRKSRKWIGIVVFLSIWIGGCSYCYYVPNKHQENLNELKNVQLELVTIDNREIVTRKFLVKNDTLFVFDDNIIVNKNRIEKIPLANIAWMKCCEFKGENAQRAGTKFFLVLGSVCLILYLINLAIPEDAFLAGG